MRGGNSSSYWRPILNTAIQYDNDRWAALANGIRNRDESATEEFYAIFRKGFRFLLLRQLGPEGVDDSLHCCLISVLNAVQQGKLQESSRLLGFASTIVRRHIIHEIRNRCAGRKSEADFADVEYFAASPDPDPEHCATKAQARQIAAAVLSEMSERKREILRRFYLLEQTEEQIPREMGLSYDEFRNGKHRAKKRFGTLWANRARAPASGIGRLSLRYGTFLPSAS